MIAANLSSPDLTGEPPQDHRASLSVPRVWSPASSLFAVSGEGRELVSKISVGGLASAPTHTRMLTLLGHAEIYLHTTLPLKRCIPTVLAAHYMYTPAGSAQANLLPVRVI